MFKRLKRGFTLIELILTLVVMGIASAGLVAVIQQVMVSVHKPAAMSVATALAVQEAERVMGLSFADVLDENRDAPASYTGAFSNYSWQVRVDQYSHLSLDDYKQVEVRVHNSAINYISIVFLRTNY